ncbi:hypothetical protein F4802DRAFT_605838 [Xylaria palmicola]|nr:hypothetical protein F4802DRAFT_605838 [Xylaria palmicola]
MGHPDDGSTGYYRSPTFMAHHTPSSEPSLYWKVGPNGVLFETPGLVESGRIYISDGDLDFFRSEAPQIVHPDPHNPDDPASSKIWGFVEFTHTKSAPGGNVDMTVNLSFVDWVSLPLGMNVTFAVGTDKRTVSIPGLRPDGLKRICDGFSTLKSFWPKLCLKANDAPLRVMSPEKYASLYPDDKDAANYYEPYINTVWEKYKNADLRINTQTDGPDSAKKVDNGRIVTCRVGQTDNILHCDSDAGDFNRPVSRDIYGCNSGPFANPADGVQESWSRARVRPRLCAAFVRSTLHLDGAQPSRDISSNKYYQQPTTNHYSRLVHENLIGGMGYAFSYDDVNPDSADNSAGLVSTTSPSQLDIFINM